MNKKNIMYIYNDTNFGGAGQSLLDTLNEIKNHINPIVIVRANSNVEEKFEMLNIRCYKIHFSTDFVKIGNSSEEKRKSDRWMNYEAALELLPIIQKERIQLIHINSSVSYFGAIAALMAHIPYIWHIRELMEEQFGCEFLNKDIKKKLYKRADRIITISDYVQKKYQQKYDVNTLRLYNGLDIKRFKNNLNKRRNYENVFLVAAMITAEKRQWDVICATELLIKKGYSDIKVVIVGDGDTGYVWALKKYIIKKNLQKNIFIIPFQDDLSGFRKQTSYAITSSQNEALGRVTIEAMLAGNLVIGARSGGTIEIIGEEEERGFLYELGNIEDLAYKMLKAINLHDMVKNEMIEKAQKYTEIVFNSTEYCGKLLKLYDEVIFNYVSKDNVLSLQDISSYFSQNKIMEYCAIQNIDILYKKSDAAFKLLSKWMEIKQKGYFIQDYFEQHKIQNVAIYGMAELGRRLYDELENSEIHIKYLIDKEPKGMDYVLEFVSLEKIKLDVDAIIVTVALSELEIVHNIKKKGYQNVIGLSEIINSFLV